VASNIEFKPSVTDDAALVVIRATRGRPDRDIFGRGCNGLVKGGATVGVMALPAVTGGRSNVSCAGRVTVGTGIITTGGLK
jgi:hypothetical protein